MKYLKIKIRRGDIAKGEPQMIYPDVYDPYEVEAVKLGPILYPGEIGRGAATEECIICFGDDRLAQAYIDGGNGDIVELSEVDVDSYMTTRWEGRNYPEESVEDPNRILAINTKIAAGIKLSTSDRNALDPDNREPGINRRNKDHNIFFHRFKVDNEPISAVETRLRLI